MVIAPPAVRPRVPSDWRTTATRLTAVVAGGLAAATATSYVVAWSVWEAAQQEKTGDMWEDLGDAIAAAAVGVLTWTVVYLIVIVIGVRKVIPYGRRALTGLAIILSTAVVPSIVGGAIGLGAGTPFDAVPIGVLMILLGLVAAASVIGAAAGIVFPDTRPWRAGLRLRCCSR